MNDSADPKWTRAVAEASAWIAIEHDKPLAVAAEKTIRVWRDANPLHAQAYEHVRQTLAKVRAGAKITRAKKSGHVRDDMTAEPRWKWIAALFIVFIGGLAVAGYRMNRNREAEQLAAEQCAKAEREHARALLELNQMPHVLWSLSHEENLSRMPPNLAEKLKRAAAKIEANCPAYEWRILGGKRP